MTNKFKYLADVGDGAASDCVVGVQSGVVRGEEVDVDSSSGVVPRENSLEEPDTLVVGLGDTAVEGCVLQKRIELGLIAVLLEKVGNLTKLLSSALLPFPLATTPA